MSHEEFTVWEGSSGYRAELWSEVPAGTQTGVEATVAIPHHVLLRLQAQCLALPSTQMSRSRALLKEAAGTAAPLGLCGSITFGTDQAWTQTISIPYNRMCCWVSLPRAFLRLILLPCGLRTKDTP